MRALTIIILAGLLAGCTKLKPLGKPATKELPLAMGVTTLEYRIPTFDEYTCPIHGVGINTVTIEGKEYCWDCAWKKALK